MIPKVLHYCWFGGKEIPPLAQRCIDSWSQRMPDFKIIRWSEAEVSAFGSIELGELLRRKQWAFASDLARLLVLHRDGGIYLDVDMEAVRPLTPLLRHQCFLGYESPGRLNNAVFGAVPQNEFVSECLNFSRTRISSGLPILYSPEVVTKVHAQKEWSSVTVLEESKFYPYNPYSATSKIGQLLYSDIREDTYLIHHWQKSWSAPIWDRIRRLWSR